jgi:hypothetical protein
MKKTGFSVPAKFVQPQDDADWRAVVIGYQSMLFISRSNHDREQLSLCEEQKESICSDWQRGI